MNTNKANAESVAPEVIRYTQTETITYDGTDYVVSVTYTGGMFPVWATTITYDDGYGLETLEVPHLFTASGGHKRETVHTDEALDECELTAIIAGTLAYRHAVAEYVAKHY